MRLLLAESGHYILPVNKQDQQLSQNEMEEVQRLWQKRNTATALEQTWHGDRQGGDDGYNKKPEKLQFAKDVIEEPYITKNDIDVDKNIAVGEEQEIQVLMGSNYDQEYDDTSQPYQGDVLPGHLHESKLKYLTKMYKAVPEEFYTQTKRRPVTPNNARSWMRKRRGSHFNFWEWCSGSGRLSLLALLSGLCVTDVPIDYRYRWDLAHPEHRKIIAEMEESMSELPDVNFYSPSCRPWSISSTRRDLAQTQRERNEEMPTVNYIKGKIKARHKRKKGYILEQPWTSALWENLKDNSGDLQRTDQCRYKAMDELENPILKPTGLQSNIQLRYSINRCNGHLGRKHGWLQGTTMGHNRTTLAAVYPEALCRAIIKDVKRYINNKNCFVEAYYKCQRCAQGRAATPDVQHSFLPGECRYGKWPEGEDPREKKKIAKEQQQQEDIFETFRREALKNEKVLQGKMSIHPDFAMNNGQTAIFKMCMVKLLSEALASFEELDQNKLEHNYTHWLEDPTSMSWLKKIFLDYMVIEGV